MNTREEISIFLKDVAEYLTGIKHQDPAVHWNNFDATRRYNGVDWPQNSLSMIGMQRMLNIQKLLFDVIDNNVPGDFIETGVWRGGACIFAATILKLLKITDRNVWVADSFKGLPKPDPKYKQDDGDMFWKEDMLRISLDEVKKNFDTFQLLTEQVKFLEGWFSETLPTLHNETFSIIRLDGDMYGSTIDALNNLYPRLSVGGYVIIDDWTLQGARSAVNDYRTQHTINDEIILIEQEGYSCYWQKSK